MGLEALCGDIEIERAHRTPTKVSGNNNKKPRPVHVAFLRYTDKVKILSNAATRLKDNPYRGKLIGIGADFAKETQERQKALSFHRVERPKVFIAYSTIKEDQSRFPRCFAREIDRLPEIPRSSKVVDCKFSVAKLEVSKVVKGWFLCQI